MNRVETRKDTDQHESVARASDALRLMLGGKSRRGGGIPSGDDVSDVAGRRSTSGWERSQSLSRGTLAVMTALRSSPTGLAAMKHGDAHSSMHQQHDGDTHSPRPSLGYRTSSAGLPDLTAAPSPHTLTARLLSGRSNSSSAHTISNGYRSSTDGRMDHPPPGALTAATSSLSRTPSSRMPGLTLTIPPSPGAHPDATGSQHHSPHPPADPRDGSTTDNDPNELYDSPCSSPFGPSRVSSAAFKRAHSRLHPSTPCTPPGCGTNPTISSLPPSAAATPPLLYSSTSGAAPCSPRAMTPTPPGYDRAPAPARMMSSRRFSGCVPAAAAAAGSPRSSFCGLGGASTSIHGSADSKLPPHGPAAAGSETPAEARLRPSQCGSVGNGSSSSSHGHGYGFPARSSSQAEASSKGVPSRASSFNLMLQQQQQQAANSGPYSSCPSALPPTRVSMGGNAGLSMQHHPNGSHPHAHTPVYVVAHVHSLTHSGSGGTSSASPKLLRGGSMCGNALLQSDCGSASARQSLSGLPSSHHVSHSRNHHASHGGPAATADSYVGYGGYDRPSTNSPRAIPRSTDEDASGYGGGYGGSANAYGSGSGGGDMRLVSSNSRRFSRGRGVGVLGDFGGGDLLGSVAKQLADLNEETEGAAQRLRERNYRRIAESKAVVVKQGM